MRTGTQWGFSVRIIMQTQHASLNHKTLYILHHESSICLVSFGEQIKLTNSILIMCPPPFWIKLFLFKFGCDLNFDSLSTVATDSRNSHFCVVILRGCSYIYYLVHILFRGGRLYRSPGLVPVDLNFFWGGRLYRSPGPIPVDL